MILDLHFLQQNNGAPGVPGVPGQDLMILDLHFLQQNNGAPGVPGVPGGPDDSGPTLPPTK